MLETNRYRIRIGAKLAVVQQTTPSGLSVFRWNWPQAPLTWTPVVR